MFYQDVQAGQYKRDILWQYIIRIHQASNEPFKAKGDQSKYGTKLYQANQGLLDANKVPLHWKNLYKLYPRKQKSDDRAYLLEAIQKMFFLSYDLTDKVIISMFLSRGLRLESWDYLIWEDVVFFKNKDETFRGMAVRIYHGDPEEYWTFGTPEAIQPYWHYIEKHGRRILGSIQKRQIHYYG